MSASFTVEGGNTKRKRTGKQREERKQAAIQAKLEAELAAAPVGRPVELEDGGDDEQGDILTPHPVSHPTIDLEKAVNRVPQALKTLRPIFKNAMVFEIRRLIKKIKFLRTKSGSEAEVTDLETQLQLLSHLHLPPVIQAHLYVKLRKHPSSRHLTLPPSITQPLTPSSASIGSSSSLVTPELVVKVENRLCSSKSVAEGVKMTVSWLLGEDGAKLVNRDGAKSKRDAVKELSIAGGVKAAFIGKRDLKEDIGGGPAVDGETFGMTRLTTAAGQGGPDEGADEEDADEDRAVDEAGWESGSISGTGHGGDPPPLVSESEDDEPIVPLPKRAKPIVTTRPSAKAKFTPAPAQRGPITSSTFLPTLSTGFTLGDSDSDPDMDRDPDGIVGTQKAERKNRRGQRARQAIWEKKFGKNAKHVIKAKEEERNGPVGNGWDADRGGRVGAGGGRGMGIGIAPAPGRGDFLTRPAPSAPIQIAGRPPTSKRGQEHGLHPSWEAAKLRKAKEIASAPKATRIVFD